MGTHRLLAADTRDAAPRPFLCPIAAEYRIASSPDHGAHPTRHFNAEVLLRTWHSGLEITVDFGACQIEKVGNEKNCEVTDLFPRGASHALPNVSHCLDSTQMPSNKQPSGTRDATSAHKSL